MTTLELRQRSKQSKLLPTAGHHVSESADSGGWWEVWPSRVLQPGNTKRDVLAWNKTIEPSFIPHPSKAVPRFGADPQLHASPAAHWERTADSAKLLLAGEWASKIPQSWVMLGVALLLESQGRLDDAMDVIYTTIDELMRNSADDELNALLQAAPVEGLTLNVMLALLTSTLPRKERLPSRPSLFERVAAELRRRHITDEGLLDGLE